MFESCILSSDLGVLEGFVTLRFVSLYYGLAGPKKRSQKLFACDGPPDKPMPANHFACPYIQLEGDLVRRTAFP